MQFINVADLKDPDDPQGRSYREVNRDKNHKFKIGDLVELDSGVRLFIAQYTRDCDQTPLYSLASDIDNKYTWVYGYSEDDMKLITSQRTGCGVDQSK